MRVDQFVPGFAKHDAIGNHALEVRRAFRRAGYDSDIWGEVIDHRLTRLHRGRSLPPNLHTAVHRPARVNWVA